MPNDKQSAASSLDQLYIRHLRESSARKPEQPAGHVSPKRPATSDQSHDEHKAKKHKSPPPPTIPTSPSAAAGSSKNTHDTPGNTKFTDTQRSKALYDNSNGFEGAPRERKALWQDGSPGMTRQQATAGAPAGNSRSQPQQQQQNPRPVASGQPQRRGPGLARGGGGVRGSQPGVLPSPQEAAASEGATYSMLKQPPTRAISQEQLVAEVKGIYAGLVMVENKCIEVDNTQSALNNDSSSPPLNADQWQALIALHRTLLHEHHDFFLASQHPAASPALRRLASKYAMPARMWRHGIHSFLELLRHRLPDSLEYMLTFIYIAYSMMALLYETVPAFEYTWIECLGDLSRYRMAIEDEDLHTREIWTTVSRSWYSKASDKGPTIGRLHHHLAILARPNIVAQLFYYLKSLCVPTPFTSARDSILTLFDPVMGEKLEKTLDPHRIFVKCHGILFTGKGEEELEATIAKFVGDLPAAILHHQRRWLEFGYQIAIANTCGLLDYGLESNILMKKISASSQTPEAAPAEGEDTKDTVMADSGSIDTKDGEIVFTARHSKVLKFTEIVDTMVLSRFGDMNILSYLHVRLMFIRQLAKLNGDNADKAMKHLEATIPWQLLTVCLNSFLANMSDKTPGEVEDFPRTVEGKPLPEDWAMRGLVWAELGAFPDDHFEVDGKIENSERLFESPSTGEQRRFRCLWLARQIAAVKGENGECRWIEYDQEKKQFRPATKYVSELEIRPAPASPVIKQEDVEADPEPSRVGPLSAEEQLQQPKIEKPAFVQDSLPTIKQEDS